MDHLGVIEKAANPLLVNWDSQAAIAYTKDPKYHGKTKHIDTKYNFVKRYGCTKGCELAVHIYA